MIVFMCAAIIAIVSHTIAIAQDQGKTKDFAEISTDGTSLSWQIKVPYQGAVLTVSAPNGKVIRQEFAAGAPITFSLLTGRGEIYVEGSFNYELVLTPVLSADTKRALVESRREGKNRELETEMRQKGVLPPPMINSGAFRVINGLIVKGAETDALPEKSGQKPSVTARQTVKSAGSNDPVDKGGIALEDQVILDDLIVDGSACIGLDCQENEDFGFDTLRLKENNTRIKFEDTSNTGSFPTTDWQLTANESTNGGLNKFSIEDVTAETIPFTVEGGAPSNSLYVDDNGKVGLGTSTPVVKLHMVEGNTPTLRLEQNNSSGFTAQTWDVAGNEANFFVRDATNGSKLPFRIKPGAPSNSIYIAPDGDVGMGTATPDGPLHIVRTVNGSTETLLLLDDSGKLSAKSFVETKSGGVIFPDGTIQTSAATGSAVGGGGTEPGNTGSLGYLGPNYSTHFIGGNGTLKPNSPANVRVDPVTNAIGVGNGGGSVNVRFNVPTNLNLADTSAPFVVYKIRYRDGDGNGAGARVLVDVFANNIDTGAVTNDVVFDSNAFPSTGTGFSTVTVCRPANTVFYNFAFHGTWIESRLSAASSGGVFGSTGAMADLAHIQVYKSATCP